MVAIVANWIAEPEQAIMSNLRVKDILSWLIHLKTLETIEEEMIARFNGLSAQLEITNRRLGNIEKRLMAFDLSQVTVALADLAATIAEEKGEASIQFGALETKIANLEMSLANSGVSEADKLALAAVVDQIKVQTAAVKQIVTTPAGVEAPTEAVIDAIAADPTLALTPEESELATTDNPLPGTTPAPVDGF